MPEPDASHLNINSLLKSRSANTGAIVITFLRRLKADSATADQVKEFFFNICMRGATILP